MAFSPSQREALRLIAAGRIYPDLVREEDGWYARWRAVGEDNVWLDELVRTSLVTPLTADAEEQRHETIHDAWLAALRSRTGLVRWDDASAAAFAAELREWHGGGADDIAARASVVFRFTAAERTFALSCAIPSDRRALKALGQAAYVYGPLRGLRRAADATLRVALTQGEAETFLRTGARDLRDAGYGTEGCTLAVDVVADAEIVEASEPRGDGRMLAAKLTVRVAGEVVTAEEIRFLLEQGSSLVFFRDRWIEVDRNILREALRALERVSGKSLTRTEALAFASGIGAVGRLQIAEARAHGWLRGLLNELRANGTFAGLSYPPVPGLRGELRDYQKRGVAWMRFLTDHGFGALLADDMGLGKTIQVIAWMLFTRAAGDDPRPVLVVAPLTLLSNWAHECAKFAPSLKVLVHQGDARHRAVGFARAAAKADVVVTSYSLLVKDYAFLSQTAWSALVLDEAQAVKNPETKAAKAVCALGAPRRIALTGTPVENTVGDLWSEQLFLNPGFLGERAAFVERFVRPLASDPLSAAGPRLRRALEPFVLRRLKSDPDIAGELGPKREIKEYCALTPRQRADYETALADWRAGERRQGDVFALLTRLKLVCDGDGDDPKAEDVPEGGKLARLLELAAQVVAAGESMLVFTQYAKVGRRLAETLGARFGRRVPFLHGGLSAAAREEEIRRFNTGTLAAHPARPNVFVLSLKAGGTGLNLVKATHVVHFDRWWNPAVENQATDRAHRIGQRGTVFVHLLIAAGTLEEHVDEILERKSALAGALVTSGEAFLAQLDAEAFERVVRLDGEGRP